MNSNDGGRATRDCPSHAFDTTWRSFLFRKLLIAVVPAIPIVLAAASQAEAAGFDCGRATTAIQNRICADPVLSDLDGTMKTVFDAIETETFGHDAETGRLIDPLGKDQVRWIVIVRDACVDTACLIGAYRDRLAELRRTWPDILTADETNAIARASDARSWKTYTNVRYRYAICYPADLLTPGPEADDADGRVFSAPSGASLRVWGRYNVTDESLAALATDLADGAGAITYRRLTRTAVTVSGRKGGEVFYARTLLGPGGAAATVRSFILTYPASQATTYDAVAAKLSSCLRVLPE